MLAIASLLLAVNLTAADNSESMSLAEWTNISQRVGLVLSSVDFSNASSVLEAKRACNSKQLEAITNWPSSLLSEILLCQGELELGIGNVNAARQFFEQVMPSEKRSLGAHAAYRLAEIEEQLLWTTPRRAKALRSSEVAIEDLTSLLASVESTRLAFMQVTKFSDIFWSRRAAYRVITLMDDVLWEIRDNLVFPSVSMTTSPFDVLFAHTIPNASLNSQILLLEQERSLLESTLLLEFKNPNDDPVLFAAIRDRAKDAYAFSLSFDEYISPPWAHSLLPNMIIRHRKQYYRLGADLRLTRMNRLDAVRELNVALVAKAQPVSYAFALAYLADEREAIPDGELAHALRSDDALIQLAGLYAAQVLPSHDLTEPILAAWHRIAKPAENSKSNFGNIQSTLFGRSERALLCLAAHFALGRESTKRILASPFLQDEEKAWLLQFRKDQASSRQASHFLTHKNALVRARTRYAIEMWHTHSFG